MTLAVARGLDQANSLDVGNDGNAGSLKLGLDMSFLGDGPGYAFGTIDYTQRLAQTPIGELSSFAKGFGGVSSRSGGGWRREFGLVGGLELSW